MTPTDPVGLDDEVRQYLSQLKKSSGYAQAQQELLRFARWFGRDRSVKNLQPFEVEGYAEQTGGRGRAVRAVERLREVKKFLAFAKKSGLIDQNLAQHLRIPKAATSRARKIEGEEHETIKLTSQGHKKLTSELEKLKDKRGPLATQIRAAAADKDVRENVPLEAAREQLGHVESRISEIEGTLKDAVVIGRSRRRKIKAVSVGAKVSLRDLDSGRRSEYTVVSATEANPLEGRISDVSPVGKALVGGTAGREIEVVTPRGSMRYRILRVSS